MTDPTCISCAGSDLITVPTYKRYWHCCRQCGTAVAEPRSNYPLRFLPIADFRRAAKLDEEKMYDYFVDPVHIEWSEREGREFIDDYLKPAGIDVAGKSILDISGGNGHFIKQLEAAGADVTLTEINKKTVEYARAAHGFPVFEYNLNEHDLHAVTGRTYDLVMARACIMFAHDLPSFAEQVRRSLNPGGTVLINHAVKPSLGVMLRVQLDEFSYYALREPEVIIDAFAQHGFDLQSRVDETDQSLYVYDHDLRSEWRFLHYLYERRAARMLVSERAHAWPARDRRRATLAMRLTE